MSNILLINPEIPMKRFIAQAEQFPNGALLIIGSILKEQGHNVKLVHMTADNIDLNKLRDIIKDFKPEIAGLTAITFQSKTLRETSKVVKETDKNIKIIAGGSHISALIAMGYSVAEDYHDIDYFVSGEGDYAISNLIEKESDSNIITLEPMKQLILPHIKMDLVNIHNFSGAYPIGKRPGMFVMGSRGCIYNCTFCSRSVFGKTVRYAEPTAVVEEIERLKKLGIKEIFFHDDTFNLNREWAEKILNLIIKKRLKLSFRTPCRVNRKLIDAELLKLMKEAGFWLIFYGVESGNQDMLDRMKKGITLEEIRRAFRLTREAGIKTEASMIVGLSGETPETIQDSIDLLREIKPDWSSFTRAIPFPNTEIYKEARENNCLLFDSFDDIEVSKTLMRTEALTGEQVERYAVMLDSLTGKAKLNQLLKNPFKLFSVLKDLKDINGLLRGVKQAWQLWMS